jgi:hypothetical protein
MTEPAYTIFGVAVAVDRCPLALKVTDQATNSDATPSYDGSSFELASGTFDISFCTTEFPDTCSSSTAITVLTCEDAVIATPTELITISDLTSVFMSEPNYTIGGSVSSQCPLSVKVIDQATSNEVSVSYDGTSFEL